MIWIVYVYLGIALMVAVVFAAGMFFYNKRMPDGYREPWINILVGSVISGLLWPIVFIIQPLVNLVMDMVNRMVDKVDQTEE